VRWIRFFRSRSDRRNDTDEQTGDRSAGPLPKPSRKGKRALDFPMTWTSWAKTEIGLVRSSNQDAVGCFPEHGLFIVADGMGGHANGELASRMAVDVLRSQIENRPEPGASDLVAAVQAANQLIFEIGHRDPSSGLPAMGTTVVALALGRRASWVHVGDSRLYRMRAGELSLLTADDTRFGRQVAMGGPVPLDLPHTNELLCALGVERQVAATTGDDDLHPGDVFLLCSDGVSGLVSAIAIRDQLAAMQDPAVTGQRLLELAMDAGGSDNASIVVIRHQG
jgi:protein phosphatase